jgi:hypothetical protein
MEISKKYLDANGNIISAVAFAKIQAEQQADEIAGRLVSDAKNAAEAKLTKSEKELRSFRGRLAECRSNGDKVGIEMYTAAISKLVVEAAEADSLVAFDRDPQVESVLGIRDALARAGKEMYAGASPTDVDLLIALVDRRHQFGSVQSFRDSYDGVMDRVSSAALEHRRQAVAEATVDAAQKELVLANAHVEYKQAEARRAGVMLPADVGGTDGS